MQEVRTPGSEEHLKHEPLFCRRDISYKTHKPTNSLNTHKHNYGSVRVCVCRCRCGHMTSFSPPRMPRGTSLAPVGSADVLHYAVLHYTILYYTVLYCTILYYTLLYYTLLYYTILYHTIPYHTITYYTII